MRARVVAHRLLFANPEPPRKVSWFDVADIFGPSFILSSVGYRVLVVAAFVLWRPQIALVAAAVLGATLAFRVVTIVRLAGPVKKILGMSVGADAIIVDAPKKGDVMVQIGGLIAPALELSRNARRPRVGQHVGVLMNRTRSHVLMYLG